MSTHYIRNAGRIRREANHREGRMARVAAFAAVLGALASAHAQSHPMLIAGVDATGAQCSEAQLQGYIDQAVSSALADGRGDMATIIDFPPNAQIRFCASGVTFPRRVHVRGNSSRVRVARDVTAFRVEPAGTNSIVELVDIVYPADADPSRLVTDPWRPYPHDGIGIDVSAGVVRLRDLRIFHAGTAIRLWGGGGANTSGMSVRDVWIYGCSKYGIEVRGGDAQGGSFVGVFVQACRNAAGNAVGILENGFLGNSHVGGMLEANDIAVVTDGSTAGGGAANASTWVGMYVETSDAVHITSNSSTVIGGTLALRPDSISVLHGSRVGGMMSRLQFSGRDVTGHTMFMEIPAARRGSWRGRWDGLITWGRHATSNVQCGQSSCPSPRDTCVSGWCRRADMPAGTHDYWTWRASPNVAHHFSWEWFNHGSSAVGARVSVSDADGDGIIREGFINPGGNGHCGYVGNVCQ